MCGLLASMHPQKTLATLFQRMSPENPEKLSSSRWTSHFRRFLAIALDRSRAQHRAFRLSTASNTVLFTDPRRPTSRVLHVHNLSTGAKAEMSHAAGAGA